MPQITIADVPVVFPFEPYDVQKAYMEKVIMCIESGTNSILESPTGTGKTLSLLCSSLGWLTLQKQKKNSDPTIRIPKIIYSSRTHSQLIQAMNELKNSSYSFMKAVVLGSRDQLCIHPEVIKEKSNSLKIHLCKLRMTTRSCSFYNNVEKHKENQSIFNENIVDIEDLITIGRKYKVCPYFMSKEFVDSADIVFMPYNYLLDPKIRKSQNISLDNTIVILDEAHNIEKICEDSASVQIKSSDIALCIDDVTQVMRMITEGDLNDGDDSKDFTIDDLTLLKEMVLEFEKAVDEIEVKKEGITYTPEFIFNLLSKANINFGNQVIICKLLDNLVQYLSMNNNNNSAFRKGVGLEKFLDFLTIVFIGGDGTQEKVLYSYKVYVEPEELKVYKTTTKKEDWLSSKDVAVKTGKIINYWCFNPGFGMDQIVRSKIRSLILTSGTLAPLKPLIAELGIPVTHTLENPHIVDKSQVCVKIISYGPDREALNSNYKNRDNIKYITSLGRTIANFCPIIPGGILIFFPSYPFMNKCVDSWQASGIWSQINKTKPIFVEPREKEAFTTAMTEYYTQVRNPATKGACFMAVCRGKVSEGLDFVDINGRAVIITGLPYPPLKDPRVMLKRQYLEQNRNVENQLLSGDQWYGLEATRAVNQAIGRVIRHKNDYGAILLCDSRFNFSNQKSQLSSWIQGHLKETQQYNSFGPFVSDIVRFFKNAEKMAKICNLRERNLPACDIPSTSLICQKRERTPSPTAPVPIGKKHKKRVLVLVKNPISTNTEMHESSSSIESKNQSSNDDSTDTKSVPTDRTELLKLIKHTITTDRYSSFIKAITLYHKNNDFVEFYNVLQRTFDHPCVHYLLKAVRRFIKDEHKENFDKNLENL